MMMSPPLDFFSFIFVFFLHLQPHAKNAPLIRNVFISVLKIPFLFFFFFLLNQRELCLPNVSFAVNKAPTSSCSSPGDSFQSGDIYIQMVIDSEEAVSMQLQFNNTSFWGGDGGIKL